MCGVKQLVWEGRISAAMCLGVQPLREEQPSATLVLRPVFGRFVTNTQTVTVTCTIIIYSRSLVIAISFPQLWTSTSV